MTRALIPACLVFAALVLAAPPSSFEGTWVRDPVASDPIGGRMAARGRALQSVTLMIEERNGVFQITRQAVVTGGQMTPLVQRWKLGGPVVTNPGPGTGGRGEMKGKAVREGARIVIRGTQQTPFDNAVANVTEVYEVSGNGDTLTITNTRQLNGSPQTMRQIFHKARNK